MISNSITAVFTSLKQLKCELWDEFYILTPGKDLNFSNVTWAAKMGPKRSCRHLACDSTHKCREKQGNCSLWCSQPWVPFVVTRTHSTVNPLSFTWIFHAGDSPCSGFGGSYWRSMFLKPAGTLPEIQTQTHECQKKPAPLFSCGLQKGFDLFLFCFGTRA